MHGRAWLLLWVLLLGGTFTMTERATTAQEPKRNEWYYDSVVNLHIDNHSSLAGKGYTAEQLTEMVRDIPVSMIQVSAFGAVGITTYPTAICPHPDLGDWDTLAVWKQVAKNCGTRYGIYINTRGLGLPKTHPEWTQLDAKGKGRGRHNGLDVCARPSADGKGVLEQVFVPLMSELGSRYQPDAVWVDGDHARTPTCYCANCRAAWKALSGKDEPPTDPEDPDWPAWCKLEQERFDEYRKQMAHALHSAHGNAMYTSNHSWRFRSKDPRSAPDFVDTLSGDLSHGEALRLTRLSAMQISPEERVPVDIMHNIMSTARKQITERRVLQQGALTLASGGAWFLWSPGSAIVQKPIQERAKLCAEFAQARRAALGRSTSLNQTAVLLSETGWSRERIGGEVEIYDRQAPEHAALALQDAGFCVDMPNEEILRARLGRYRTVAIANQRSLTPETMAVLKQFVGDGGQVIVTGSGLRDDLGQEGKDAAAFLGVERGDVMEGPLKVTLGDETAVFPAAWDVRPGEVEVLATFDNGKPFLTRRRAGKGWVAYLAVPSVPYPDDDGILAHVMRALGNGPAVHIDGTARDRHLLFALRRKPGQVILHVSDMTSHVRERRIIPTTQNQVDNEPPIPEIELSLPLPSAPKSVTVVPKDTMVSHRWEKGILHLTLKNMGVHGAVVLETDAKDPLAYLSAETPMAKRHVLGQFTEEDFETLSVRAPVPESVGRIKADAPTAIRVTAKTAASGRHSLKFVDHPDAPQPYLPYFRLSPRGLNRDVGYFCFDMRLEPEAEAQVELRTTENARQFPVGPSVCLSGKGRLSVAGREEPLAAIPADTWFHVDIVSPLDRSGTYELRLRVPGKEEQVFKGLPFRSPAFCRCGWIGILAVAKTKSAFYVDNLRAGRAKPDKIEEALRKKPAAGAAAVEPLEIVKEDGLCGYWRFDEGAGDVARDCSGHSNHADVAAEWAEGGFGRALRLTGKRGANAFVEDDPSLRFGTSDFTIMCWVCPTSLESPKTFRRLMDKPGFPETWWDIDIHQDGRVEMEMADESRASGTTVSKGAIPLKAWTHVAIVVDRANREVCYYFNGRLDSECPIPEAFTGALDVRGRDLFIGSGYLPFIGLLDEVRVYKRAVTAGEIMAICGKDKRSAEHAPAVP